MNETNAERLGRIKKLHNAAFITSENDVDWLIEQAEQVGFSRIIGREYDLLQIENNRLQGLYKKACKEVLDLKVAASIKGMFDSVELSNDAKELNLKLLKKNVENMRLREALKLILTPEAYEDFEKTVLKCLKGDTYAKFDLGILSVKHWR